MDKSNSIPKSWPALLMLVGLLQACTPPLKPSVIVSGPTIQKPADTLMKPPPQDDWLGNAQTDAQKWQKQLQTFGTK